MKNAIYFPVSRNASFGDRIEALKLNKGISSDAALAREIFFNSGNYQKTDNEQTNEETIQGIRKRIFNQKKSGNPQMIFLKEYCTVLDCESDFLLGYIDYPSRDTKKECEITGLSYEAINYLKNASEYERVMLDVLLKKEYYLDILIAIHSYMQTYYKEIKIQDIKTGNITLTDTEKMEIAEYRATKHFSDVLVNKISNDDDIKKCSTADYALEIISHLMHDKNYKQSFDSQTIAAADFIKTGEGTLNDYIDLKESALDETTE